MKQILHLPQHEAQFNVSTRKCQPQQIQGCCKSFILMILLQVILRITRNNQFFQRVNYSLNFSVNQTTGEKHPLAVNQFKAFSHLTLNFNDPAQIHNTLNGQVTTHKLTNNN